MSYRGIFFHLHTHNKLPNEIKILIHNTKKFKNRLKAFLQFYSFYTIQEYFNHQNE